MTLRSSADDLSDLASGVPELIDADVGVRTGVRIVKRLGVGGMATVFLGERDAANAMPSLFAPITPTRMAIKVMQPATVRQITKLGGDPLHLFRREVVALGKLAELHPPTPFVVAFYGCGLVDVETRDGATRLPWIALEYVDGGTAGTSLTERVEQTRGGVDPIRAARLVRAIGEGVRAIHLAKIVHRDLKPDNVLVAGPIDDEVPKITDCGIARVDGIATGLAAATRAYAGFEQMVSLPLGANPLVGPWTDVHALAAVVWFVIAGEQWCADNRWFTGDRRSLRTATRLHPGFTLDADLLARLDAALARGAAPGIPPNALQSKGAEPYVLACKTHFPSALNAPHRYDTVEAFGAELVPVLDRIASVWRARAASDARPVTAYRATAMVPSSDRAAPAKIDDVAPKKLRPFDPNDPALDLRAGCVAFQPDGKALACSKTRVVFFIDGQPYLASPPVGVTKEEHRARIGRVDRAVYAGELGYALVGKREIVLIRGGQWRSVALPMRVNGGAIGDVEAALGARGRLLIVTAETDDSDGGPELWSTHDGAAWEGPTPIPINGSVTAIAEGPFGALVVGRRGGKARAAFVSPDGAVTVYAQGLGATTPLIAATCGAERESWGAAEGSVVRFDRASVEVELSNLADAPVQLALDLVGVPWLLARRSIHRRAVEGSRARWSAIYERAADRPALVGLGFTPDGAIAIDAAGGVVRVAPSDVRAWQR